MAEGNLALGIVIGLLVGLPIGIALGWVITQHFTGGLTSTKSYSNVEEWEIVKDERGRTRGIRVHRRAEES